MTSSNPAPAPIATFESVRQGLSIPVHPSYDFVDVLSDAEHLRSGVGVAAGAR